MRDSNLQHLCVWNHSALWLWEWCISKIFGHYRSDSSPAWLAKGGQLIQQGVYLALGLLELLLSLCLQGRRGKVSIFFLNGKSYNIYIYNHSHSFTFCVFCCTVVLMAVSSSDSDVFTESVRALYCSFILVSTPWRFSLSSGLRLSPRSARSSSTERIASAMPSRLVWRSFRTSWRVRENRFDFKWAWTSLITAINHQINIAK